MRIIPYSRVKEKVKEACIEASYILDEEMVAALGRARQREESPLGKKVLEELIENARLAKEERLPLCQDTGTAVFFVELGDQVAIAGGLLTEAINEGVREGYGEGYLRKSICHPFTRKNTGDNTPAVIHVELVAGEGLKMIFCAKGGGSENMSRVTMLNPSDGMAGVEDFVVQRIWEAQANPCPPIIVGVGVGANFERVALLAKKSLTLPINERNEDPLLAEMEDRILGRINDLGIGPGGLGGRVTALAVRILMEPCHIASLPVAVNINCHANRHREINL